MYINLDSIERIEPELLEEKFVLCYVDSIPEISFDWETGKEIDHPEYDYDTSTHFAYFADFPLECVWGDDFDNIPYEHNSGIPYDIWKKEEGKYVNGTILRVSFGWNNVDNGLEYKLPLDNVTFGGNSPWSIVDINSKQVPWLWCGKHVNKSLPKYVCLFAGASLGEFIKFLEEVKKLGNE